MTPNNERLLRILAERAGLDADTATTMALSGLIKQLNLGHLLTIKPAKPEKPAKPPGLSNGVHLFMVAGLEVDRFGNSTRLDMVGPNGIPYSALGDINLGKWIGTHLSLSNPDQMVGRQIEIVCHGGVPIRTSDRTLDGFKNDSVEIKLTSCPV